MLVSYVYFTGRLADTMLLHASSVVVGTTQIHLVVYANVPSREIRLSPKRFREIPE